MSNWETQKIKTLKKQWASLTSGRNTSDHSLAQWANRAITALDEGEFIEFCTHPKKGLGVHHNTAHGYERMARALEKVAQPEVWKAVGWDGVRTICRIEKNREVSSICRWVTQQAKKGPVSEAALQHRIEQKAPSYKAPGGRGGGGGSGGSGGPTKKALQDQLDVVTVERNDLKTRYNALAKDLTRVIAKWPIIKNDLKPETIAALGLEGGQLPKVKSA